MTLMRFKRGAYAGKVVEVMLSPASSRTVRSLGGGWDPDALEEPGPHRAGDRVRVKDTSQRQDLHGRVYEVAAVDDQTELKGLGRYKFLPENLELVAYDEPLALTEGSLVRYGGLVCTVKAVLSNSTVLEEVEGLFTPEALGDIRQGDLVRVRHPLLTTSGQHIHGKVFRVAKVLNANCFGLEGVPGVHMNYYTFSKDYLDLVSHKTPAETTTLMRLKTDLGRVVRVSTIEGDVRQVHGRSGTYHAHNFEPVGDIRVGDHVRVKSSARDALIGKVFQVSGRELSVVSLVGLDNYTFDEQKLEIVAWDEPLSPNPYREPTDHYLKTERAELISARDKAQDALSHADRENANLRTEIVNLKNARNTAVYARENLQAALRNSQETLLESEKVLAARDAGLGKLVNFIKSTNRYEWVEGFPKDDPTAEAQWRIQKLEEWLASRTKDLDIARKATALESEHVMRLKLKAYEGPPPKPGLLSRLFDDFAIGFGALSAAASIVGSALKRFWGRQWQRSWLKPDRYEGTIEQIGGTMAVSLALMLTALMFCSPMAFYYDHYVWSVERAADAIVVPAPPRQDDPRERSWLEARAAQHRGRKWL